MEDYRDELSPGMKCVKYLVVAFNSIFVMTGVLIIAVGTTIHSIYYNFDEFLETRFFSPATLLIVIGSFIFLIAIFGCIGAAKESTCMMNVFGVLLGLIFILEISAGIAAFALQNEIRYTIANNMNETMHESKNDAEAADTIDFIQRGLSCCGIYGPDDWKGILDEKAYFSLSKDEIVLPDSCCSNITKSAENEDSECVHTNFDGCLPRLSFVVGQSAVLLGGAALAVSVIQIIGMYFSFSLAKYIRRAKSERLHRQFEIRRQLQNTYSLMDNAMKDKTETPIMHLNNSGNSTT